MIVVYRTARSPASEPAASTLRRAAAVSTSLKRGQQAAIHAGSSSAAACLCARLLPRVLLGRRSRAARHRRSLLQHGDTVGSVFDADRRDLRVAPVHPSCSTSRRRARPNASPDSIDTTSGGGRTIEQWITGCRAGVSHGYAPSPV